MKSLATQMGVYAAYHRHPMNKAIHMVFIPAIVWSIMVFLGLVSVGTWSNIEITLAHLAVLPLLIWYLRLDFGLGVAAVVVFTVLLVTALQVAALPTNEMLAIGGSVFVAGWVFQFIGHGVWEKRRPALVDNVFQIFVAPAFLVAEAAFGLGFRKALAAEVEAEMQQHLPKA